MPDFRRWRVAGGSYFFTVVTYRRRRLLCRGSAPALLREALRDCRKRMPFQIDAIVVLPDHLHAIWTLPPGEYDFSKRWGIVKSAFTKAWLALNEEPDVADAKKRERRRGVWQARFWEHAIRDEAQFEAYLDYIHFNPVRHGWARSPAEWKWSSFRRWVDRKVYPPTWGAAFDPALLAKVERLAEQVGE